MLEGINREVQKAIKEREQLLQKQQQNGTLTQDEIKRDRELKKYIDSLTTAQQKSAQEMRKYADVMNLMLEYADQTEAVEVWGLTDNMSWRSYEYPLLFSAGCEPKPAFWAVAEPEKYAE